MRFCFCQEPCHPWDWMNSGLKGIWLKNASLCLGKAAGWAGLAGAAIGRAGLGRPNKAVSLAYCHY